MSTPPVQPPEERIQAMKARVEKQKERKREAEEKAGRVRAAAIRTLNGLTGRLLPLKGLPVRDPGRTDVMAYPLFLNVKVTDWPYTVQLGASYLAQFMTFTLDGNWETEQIWLTHDGDRITEEAAFDLAVAFVEARLFVEGEEQKPAGPTWPKGDDIPF
jgi:hypothetical protein